MRQLFKCTRFAWGVLFFFSSATSFGQHRHYIYFQQEQLAPFFIKYQGQIYRSSPQGYLLLSKINKGSHQLYFGLDSSNALIKFSLENIDSDRGYLVKYFEEIGWGLFDFQNSSVIYAAKENEKQKNAIASAAVQNDKFSDMLANVIKDSTVKYVNDSMVLDDIENTEVGGEKRLTENSINKTVDSILIVADTMKPIHERSLIVMQNRQQVDSAVNVSIIVYEKNKQDTVVITFDSEDASKGVQNVISNDRASIAKDSVIVRDRGFDTLGLTKTNVRNICRRIAWEDDFINLRQTMAGQRTEEHMIAEAEKIFGQMCFSTQQLGQLCVLLTSDEMKYRFFSKAYKHVLDLEQFHSLGKHLESPEYRQRFDDLIHQK
ncbi:MAG: hypothetical protein ACK55K_06060 [Bacteroidota bacterium]